MLLMMMLNITTQTARPDMVCDMKKTQFAVTPSELVLTSVVQLPSNVACCCFGLLHGAYVFCAACMNSAYPADYACPADPMHTGKVMV
jgi:hypothetical protein